MSALLVAVLVLVALGVLRAPARRRVRGLAGPRRAARPRRASGDRTASAPVRGGIGRTDVAEVVSELATLTRGGLMPSAAWAAAASGLGDDPVGQALRAAAAAGAQGHPVSAALRRRPATGLRAGELRALAALASTWQVQEATGAPVADLLARTAAALRADADAELARRSAMAAPAATARVLVALPLLGLALGMAVGADPLHVMVSTRAGQVSAVTGVVAAVTGWWWTRALLRTARNG